MSMKWRNRQTRITHRFYLGFLFLLFVREQFEDERFITYKHRIEVNITIINIKNRIF